jgi:hypothetical protein
MLAIHLMAFSLVLETNRMRIAPASGVNKINDNSGKFAALVMVLAVGPLGPVYITSK